MQYLADTTTRKRPAYNERFGATAAGSADLKGSAEMPPLRQAAIPLYAIEGRFIGKIEVKIAVILLAKF